MEAPSTLLIPRDSRLFPGRERRRRSGTRVLEHPPTRFESYTDWFYFIHIDPAQRVLHALGMLVGSLLFLASFVVWSKISFLIYGIGICFFYGTGIVSHRIYDDGAAKSDPRYFLVTFWPVIDINLQTIFGYYDRRLRAFVDKYPFVRDSFDLVEIPRGRLTAHLLQRNDA